MIFRYVRRHIPRAPVRSLLSLLLAAALIASLGQFVSVVRSNRALVGRMYDTVDVYASVINRSGAVSAAVPYAAIETLLEADFASSYYAESRGPLYWVTPSHEEVSTIYNFTDAEEFGRMTGVVYADGYDGSMFLESDEKVCVVSERALEETGLSLGDTIHISGASLGIRLDSRTSQAAREGVEFTIVGTFGGGLGTYDVATPFWTMKVARYTFYAGSYEGSGKARTVEFRIRNELLRDPAAYRDAPNEALYSSVDSDVNGLALRVLDSEVTNVIVPLDRNTNLLEMLLPMICAVVTVIGAAIPGLVIIQSAKEAAIMRVLGTPRGRVRAALTLEQTLLCAVGLAAGVAALAAAHGFGGEIMPYLAEILLCAAIYLAAAVAACFACSVSVSARKPLELLQTRE